MKGWVLSHSNGVVSVKVDKKMELLATGPFFSTSCQFSLKKFEKELTHLIVSIA